MTSLFRTTKWSTVLAARDDPPTDARRALAALCEAYWYPLYAYVRSQGFDPEQAKDLTQGYFARLLEKGYLRSVEPSAGRFRNFLIVTMRRFLLNELQKERALKRGGGARTISLDAEQAEERYRQEPVDRLTPEEIYERRWALTVLARVLEALRREYYAAGKQDRFDLFRGYLTGEEPRAPYRVVAGRLEMTEPAVRVAVRRLRQRFGSLLKAEIAETVGASEEVDDEVRHLLAAVAPQARA